MVIEWCFFTAISLIFSDLVIKVVFYSFLFLQIVINWIKKKCHAFFRGTIHGKVVMKNSDTTITPLRNIEVYFSYPTAEPRKPVFTDATGKFRFECEIPIGKSITVSVKIRKTGKSRFIHQDIGEIEAVKWLLGKRWIGIPISSGDLKHVDFVVTDFERTFV